MDERTIEPTLHRASSSSEQPSQDSKVVSLHGSEIRIDRPHASSTIGESAPASAQPAEPAATAPQSGSARLQQEAGRIFQQIQLQLAEITEREAAQELRHSTFEAEQRQFHLQRMAEQAALDERRQKLDAGEADLAQRLEDTRALLGQIEAARIAVEQERASVERQRATLRDQLLAELQDDRQAVDADRLELNNDLQRIRELKAALEEKLHETTAEAERLIQGERERLWQALVTEWEDRRAQFQREHDAWLSTAQAERVEIEREKAFYEAAVRNAEADFTAAREAQQAELDILRDEHLQMLAALRQEAEQAIAAEQAAFQAEKQSQTLALQTSWGERIAQLEAEKKEFQESIAAQQAEFQIEKQQQLDSLRSEWGEQIAALEAERESLKSEQDQWNKTRTIQLAEVQGERGLLESRIRFQQEHLEKLRSDLERSQNEHRQQRQLERQRLEDDGIQLLRRMRQIDLYRASIDEREKSLEREREVLEKTRRAISSSADQDRLALQREQSAWQAERQIQQAELMRQQELYSSHMDSLESRRIRLEKLRTELEDTHRSTLEMRLAVEEAWVELSQAAGQEDARQRVEEVRNSLVGYYRQLHEGLVEQRREHLESQTRFERMRAEFHDERQKLMEWIGSREQELRVGEERLRMASSDQEMRDSSWKAARDRWMQEKAEAERVIRKLLGELGNQHRDPAQSLSALSSLANMGEAAAVIPAPLDSRD